MPGAVITLLISLEVNPIIELTQTSTIVMHYLRKSKPSAGTRIPSPTPSAKVIRKLTSRKDPKTLGATSSAIALSINSAFSDTPGTSNDGVTVQGTDTILQTTYAAVRMAVDITKESSDLCLPLKAVVGAMSALMKNYDVRMTCFRTKHLLILRPSPTLASIGQHREYKGYRAEGTVAVWRACL